MEVHFCPKQLSRTGERKQRSPGRFSKLRAVPAAALKKIEDFAG